MNRNDTASLYRVVLGGPAFGEVERLEVALQAPDGVLDVVMGPDGFLYFSTSRGIYKVVGR